jgi:hypothetical protein
MTGDELLNASLAGCFVPFRSSQFKPLAHPHESLTFAMKLWTQIFSRCDPKLIITIDQHTTRGPTQILNAKSGGTPSQQQFPIGWKTYPADLFTYGSVGMLRLPHLSRFAIFGREASQSHVEGIIAAVVPHLR